MKIIRIYTKDIVVCTDQFDTDWSHWSRQYGDTLFFGDPDHDDYWSALGQWELVVRRKLYDIGYDAEIVGPIDGRTVIAQRNGPDRHLPLPDEESHRIASIIESIRWPLH